nr:hypothetical protein [Tanacetum cinerariifolium]
MHPVVPPCSDYVTGSEHPSSPDYVPGPEHPPSLVYVPKPEHPEYLVPFDAEAPLEDQPVLDDASLTALSLGYVADFDPEEDLEEDPEEDHADYPASSAVPVVDPIPSAGDTDAFETDESAPTPPSPTSPQIVITLFLTRLRRARKMARPQTPILFPYEAEIPSPPPPVSSPPLPLPSPTVDSLTYAKAPLGYRAAKIRMRAASPPLLLPSTSYRTNIPDAKMSPRKSLLYYSRFHIRGRGEFSS